MAITYDNMSVATSVNAVTSLTWAHTVGSGTNRCLIVGLGYEGTAACTGVTYNTVALTRRTQATVNSAPTDYIEQWELLDATMPAAGAHNIVASWGSNVDCGGGATSWSSTSGSHNGNTGGVGAGTGTVQVVITSATGEIVVDHFAYYNDRTVTAGTGTNRRYDSQDTLGNVYSSVAQSTTGAASVTTGYTTNNAHGFWQMSGLSLQAVVSLTVAQYQNALEAARASGGRVGVNRLRL